MARMKAPNGRSDLRARVVRTPGGGRLLEVNAWIPSEVKAISPLADRLMRLIEGSRCASGEEFAVELALHEALNNAVVHGNRNDAHKVVHVRCRCDLGKGVSLTISDQGHGFDAAAIPDPTRAGNSQAESGRGIRLMKWAMDEVSFKHGGTEVHMRKTKSRTEQRTSLGTH